MARRPPSRMLLLLFELLLLLMGGSRRLRLGQAQISKVLDSGVNVVAVLCQNVSDDLQASQPGDKVAACSQVERSAA